MAGTYGGVDLEDFIGDWRDTLGHLVRVSWARKGNRGGELDVELIKRGSNRDPIRLNVKSLGRGRYNCGHYELVQEESSAMKIVWGDQRNRGKVSVWEREGDAARSRERRRSHSRSCSQHCRRSRSRRRRSRDRGGEVIKDRDELARELAIRRSENPPNAGFINHGLPVPPYGLGGYVWNGWGYTHQPYLPPHPAQATQPPIGWQGSNPGASAGAQASSSSVWQGVSTPGAWAPPAKEPGPQAKEPGIYDDILPTGSSLPAIGVQRPLSPSASEKRASDSEGTGKNLKADRFLEVASLAYDRSLANSVPLNSPLLELPLAPAKGDLVNSKPLVPELLESSRSELPGAKLDNEASSDSGPEVVEPAPSPEEMGGAPKEPSEPQGVSSNLASGPLASKSSKQSNEVLTLQVASTANIDLNIGSPSVIAVSGRLQEAPQDPRRRHRSESVAPVADTVVLEISGSKQSGTLLEPPLRFDLNPQSILETEEARQPLQPALVTCKGDITNAEDEKKQLSEYDDLLLSGGVAKDEQDPPWKRHKSRRDAAAVASVSQGVQP